MNDPHVEYLEYRIEHGPDIDWSKAEPAAFEEDEFSVEVKDLCVRFRFTTHYASAEDARSAVESHIRNWEFHAGLLRGPDAFSLRFVRAEIADRLPPAGLAPIKAHISSGIPRVTVNLAPPRPPAYPKPPGRGLCRTPDVESMYQRYLGYRAGKEPLPSMAYFCLTMLNWMSKPRPASAHFGIANNILRKVSDLSSNRGGQAARKAEGSHLPYTKEDEQFLKIAVRTMTLRAAEVECDPGAAQNPITMDDITEQAG